MRSGGVTLLQVCLLLLALFLLLGVHNGLCFDLGTYHSPMLIQETLVQRLLGPTTGLNSTRYLLPHRPWWPEGVRREWVVATMVAKAGLQRERLLEGTVASLEGQVDQLNVFLQGYTAVPHYLLGKSWVTIESSAQFGELGDWAKILWAHTFPPAKGYHFLVEEGIEYPRDYVSHLVSKIEMFNRKAIISAGGRKLNLKKFDSYRDSSVLFHHCDYISRDFSTHILSTEAMAYHIQTVRFDIDLMLSQPGYADTSVIDVLLSAYAQIKTIGQVVVAHPANWLKTMSQQDDSRTLTDKQSQEATEVVRTNWQAFSKSKSNLFASADSLSVPFTPFFKPALTTRDDKRIHNQPTLASLLALYDEMNQNIFVNIPTGAMLEGGIFTSPAKLHYFYRLAMSPFIRTVCEVGFNAGHSAVLWLHVNPNVKVIAFDLFTHKYSKLALDYVGMRFPGMQRSKMKQHLTIFIGRITVVKGDSRHTLPKCRQAYPDVKCDVMHVDGGHEGDVPLMDTSHMYLMVDWSKPNVFILDDTNCTAPYCQVCNKLWKNYKEKGWLQEYFCVAEGPNKTSGHCVGRFLPTRPPPPRYVPFSDTDV